jgi:hypothetical protein
MIAEGRLDVSIWHFTRFVLVPLFDFVGQRDTLIQWAERKGEEGLMTHWKERNQWSLDDQPTGLLSTEG